MSQRLFFIITFLILFSLIQYLLDNFLSLLFYFFILHSVSHMYFVLWKNNILSFFHYFSLFFALSWLFFFTVRINCSLFITALCRIFLSIFILCLFDYIIPSDPYFTVQCNKCSMAFTTFNRYN